MSRILRQAGFAVTEAATGQEALRQARNAPDLMVLDVKLPDIDGYDVCRRLKADAATAALPVLHLSATRISARDRSEGLESGADAYLTQPVDPMELIATVNALLRLSKAEERARQAAREWEAVFNAIGDCVCLLDAMGRILRGNNALATLVGAERGSLSGRAFAEVLAHLTPGTELPLPLQTPIPYARGGSSGQPAAEIHVGLRWLRVSCEVIPPLLGDEIGAATAVVVLTDITQTKEAALRQRAILRDILRSVTEGQLQLCFGPEDLPAALTPVSEPLSLTRPTLRKLRQQVLEAAEQMHFGTERGQDLETAVGEGGMNAVVHARAAVGQVCTNGADTIQVWLRDKGEGIDIDRLPQATLERGYTTAGTLGHGFYLMLKTVDRIFLLTGPTGTTVVLEQGRESIVPSWVNRM